MMVHSWTTQHIRLSYRDKITGKEGYLDPNVSILQSFVEHQKLIWCLKKNWNYNHRESYPSIDLLLSKFFPSVGARPLLMGQGGDGVVMVIWWSSMPIVWQTSWKTTTCLWNSTLIFGNQWIKDFNKGKWYNLLICSCLLVLHICLFLYCLLLKRGNLYYLFVFHSFYISGHLTVIFCV